MLDATQNQCFSSCVCSDFTIIVFFATGNALDSKQITTIIYHIYRLYISSFTKEFTLKFISIFSLCQKVLYNQY